MKRVARRFQATLLSYALLAVLALVTGCEPMAYSPGALFAAPDTNVHATRRRGCIDVSASLGAHERIPASSAIVTFALANACEHAESVDLSRITVVGKSGDGVTALLPYDPDMRLGPTLLDGLREGKRTIRYDGPNAGSSFDAVCVDFRGLAEGQDDGFGVVCFAPPGDRRVLSLEEPGVARALGRCEDREPYAPWRNDCFREWEAWDASVVPRFRADFGVSYRSMQTAGLTLNKVDGGHYGAEPLGDRIQAGLLDIRMAGFASKSVYVGGELDVGGGTGGGAVLALAPTDLTTRGPSMQVLGGVVVGVELPRRGSAQARLELFGGGDLIVVGADSSACGVSACPGLIGGRALLEPRFAADFWATPLMSFGGWAGADVLHPGDWSAGLAFTLHARSFDGR